MTEKRTRTQHDKRQAAIARQDAFKKALGTVGDTKQKAKAWREYDAACDYEDELDQGVSK